MIKNSKDEVILILEELILFCKKTDKQSMQEVYEVVKNDLQKKEISADKAQDLYRYFCGYSNHVDPPKYEEIRVQKLINLFKNWQKF